MAENPYAPDMNDLLPFKISQSIQEHRAELFQAYERGYQARVAEEKEDVPV